MPVTAEIDNKAPLPMGRKYPYIGISSHVKNGDLIVLFVSNRTGTVLKSAPDTYTVGVYMDRWSEDSFAVLQLPLIMKNTP